jgi:hypothetical protein
MIHANFKNIRARLIGRLNCEIVRIFLNGSQLVPSKFKDGLHHKT